MKNDIMYYYNMNINNIKEYNGNYYFTFNDSKYEFVIYNRDIRENEAIYMLNRNMINNNILVNKIILNKDNYVVTYINNIPYIMYIVYIDKNKNISLNDIAYLSNKKYMIDNLLTRNNWDILWSNKIDYFEYQMNQMGKKYPIVVDTFSYFASLAENAISYAKNTMLEVKKENEDDLVISHRKLDNSLESLYDPLNIIFDHKSRDIAEYIKLSFFKENKNIYNELDFYFKNNYYSLYGIRLLYSRIIYPSFYFDIYESIMQGISKESDLLNIVTKINDYELYLKDMYYYLRKFYDIPSIEWIIKN